MRIMLGLVALLLLLAVNGFSADLYKVTVDSDADASALKDAGAEPLMWVPGGYLVLADTDELERGQASGLIFELLASDITRDEIVLDGRRDDYNADRFEVLYERDGVRLFKATSSELKILKAAGLPIRNDHIEIEYLKPTALSSQPMVYPTELTDLVDEISQDSLFSYVTRLQNFTERLTGTDSLRAARDWLETKFVSYGYDSIYIDTFVGEQLWDYHEVESYNVVVTKVGTVHPEKHIVIGAHYDGVPDAPAADDNGSGTAAFLEIARVLQAVDLDMTVIFVGFDSEESGLFGSYRYVDQAILNGDDIVTMINHDMIGYEENETWATVNTGADLGYGILWSRAAESLVGINSFFDNSAYSDHFPFQQAGIPVTFLAERVFSNVYHSPFDLTNVMDFEYMTRLVKPSLATVWLISQSPAPVIPIKLSDGGDGQSLEISWEPGDPAVVDHYAVEYYPVADPATISTVTVPYGTTSYLIESLAFDEEYTVRVLTVAANGMPSAIYWELTERSLVIPRVPEELVAGTVLEGIKLSWEGNNTEVDFDHYELIRDGLPLPYAILDTFFVDPHPIPDTAFYSYQVVAVDGDGNFSGIAGQDNVFTRAAALLPVNVYGTLLKN